MIIVSIYLHSTLRTTPSPPIAAMSYEFKRLGYDLNRVAEKVAGIYKINPGEIFQKSRQRTRADARGLFCYWCSSELGLSLTELARKLKMTVSGVGYVVKRGEALAKRSDYRLIK